MLIVLPSTPATEKASEYLMSQGFDHELIPIPDEIEYRTGADIAIYTESPQANTMLAELTQQRFVVMRVFKAYHRSASS